MQSEDAIRRWDEMYETFDEKAKNEIKWDWFQTEDRIEIEKYYKTGGKHPYDRFILDFSFPTDIVVHAPSRSAEGLVVDIGVIVDFVNKYFNANNDSGEYFKKNCVREVRACEYRMRASRDYRRVADAAKIDEETEIQNRNRGNGRARCVGARQLLHSLDRFV
jgi:hypothetical protein